MGSTSRRKPRKNTNQSMLDLEFLRGLIEAIDDSGIDSLEITRAGTRIRVSKTPPPASSGSGGGITTHVVPAGVGQPPAPQERAAPGNGDAAAEVQRSSEAEESAAAEQRAAASNLIDVDSPMVGTFYRSPSPEAPPYVEVGTRVSKGQTLCILEAMKLMNELEAEVDGVIREILIENGEPVEYGQALFRIEPS